MYHSVLLIDTGNDPDKPRPGRAWLKNAYRVHQRLCMAFPLPQKILDDPLFLAPFSPDDFDTIQVHTPRDVQKGFLFRVDPLLGGRAVILVRSAIRPNWDYAFHNAGYLLAAPPEINEYRPQLSPNQVFRFCLLANPTRKIDTKSGPDGERRNGRRVPVRDEALLNWLASQAERHGFEVDESTVCLEKGYISMRKSDAASNIRLRAVRYTGLLRVVDKERFISALVTGIGPGKAFGFGMLTITPVQQPSTT
ncbi:MAG TPA: type I-E CRISPR-associated protein Cas6/Cse3/CasE [Candidatus Hydrogenedentes bacterium]|nr:type I-E CRISPR-associated protein Cas6/Cse3/CasE [Candidatus Hydrogenedentota bacterium]HOL75725.1 type I-E CRISPR-associated protein Cas6/Cse3/CasE [Candidatus Hydrogenedentota bacterium]HPO84282.1 type I-E CRISPR-associated protein Cas6/Cse3/CasE [Candidatus Hydrogenedentota bacterium]